MNRNVQAAVFENGAESILRTGLACRPLLFRSVW
jgi:hypothetical protein